MHCDLLIRNGTLFDGLSDAGYIADIAVRSGRIAAITPAASRPIDGPGAAAVRNIDAAGRFVLPGFIDIHAHSDFAWLLHPAATSKLLAGVTTEIGGNCGYGAFPLAGEVLRRRQLDHAHEAIEINWHTASDYFARIESSPCAVNRGVLMGHGNVRGVTVGYDNVPATASDRAAMRKLVEDGLSAGALGLSSGLIYPPGCFADAAELADLAAVVHDHDGIYASHIRNEHTALLEAVDEFLDVLRRSGCRGQLSHLKSGGRLPELRQRLLAARDAGLDFRCDAYPYIASSTGLMSMLLRRWATEGTHDQIMDRLRDRAACERIAAEASQYGEPFLDNVLVHFVTPSLSSLTGLSLRQIGAARNQPPIQAAIDLLIQDELNAQAVHFCMDPDHVRTILSWDFVMVGSDSTVRDAAKPDFCHPRAFGTPARFLTDFVNAAPPPPAANAAPLSSANASRGWPAAARKLATMAADTLRLADRGRLAPGCWADIVVLDPAAIADRATYQQPAVTPAGIDYVIVNGQVAAKAGAFTGALAGRVLRR